MKKGVEVQDKNGVYTNSYHGEDKLKSRKYMKFEKVSGIKTLETTADCKLAAGNTS